MSQIRNRVAEKDPLVFMDVSIDGVDAGRMIFELFKDRAPATVRNFCALCTGEKGVGKGFGLPLHYKGSFFYPIGEKCSLVKCGEGSSIVKGGDFFNSAGICGESIYGGAFPDEHNNLEHCCRGLLSMAIADRFGLGSHFVITLKGDHSLDRFHLVFGRLVKGFETLEKIENALVKVEDAFFAKLVRVFDCGCLSDNDEGEECNLNNAVKARALAAAELSRQRPRQLHHVTLESYRKEQMEKRKKCSCCRGPFSLGYTGAIQW